MCVYSVEIQTTGLISMKFGMGILLNGGKVCSWDLTPYPNPQGQGALNVIWHASSALTIQFGDHFIKQKL